MDANGDRSRPGARTLGPNGHTHTPSPPRDQPSPARARGEGETLAVYAHAEAAVVQLLRTLGEDPEREGLQGTPRRVVKALLEMTQGYGQDAAEILSTTFEQDHEEMVLVRAIPFTSLCEHHLLPIRGQATVAYLPDGRVVGLSKISRLVQAFAGRLQIQERMTRQIAQALADNVGARGVAVMVEAEHACMSLRGVKTPATMVTTTFSGELDEQGAKDRFLDQARAPAGGGLHG